MLKFKHFIDVGTPDVNPYDSDAFTGDCDQYMDVVDNGVNGVPYVGGYVEFRKICNCSKVGNTQSFMVLVVFSVFKYCDLLVEFFKKSVINALS